MNKAALSKILKQRHKPKAEPADAPIHEDGMKAMAHNIMQAIKSGNHEQLAQALHGFQQVAGTAPEPTGEEME